MFFGYVKEILSPKTKKKAIPASSGILFTDHVEIIHIIEDNSRCFGLLLGTVSILHGIILYLERKHVLLAIAAACGKVCSTAASLLQNQKLRERVASAGKSWKLEDLRTLANQITPPAATTRLK